ncbi:MAG: hypothetical protein OXJ62_00540 [Spirochaetaceae bacterium]|nr:hypothetical protein [Spirochaetaceae bacterium]
MIFSSPFLGSNRLRPPAAYVAKRVRGILAALAMAETIEGFNPRGGTPDGGFTGCRGERRNEWSVSVSGNWRVTFDQRGATSHRLR